MENWSSRRIRELTPEIALRGMAANKIGCARISMMVRSTSSKARPDTLVQDRTPGSPFSLATHGGSIHFGGKDEVIGLPACGWRKIRVLRFRLMVKRGPHLRPQASEGEAQHGLFCWTRRVGQGDERLHCG